MSDRARLVALGSRIAEGKASIDEIADFVSLFFPEAVRIVNSRFAPRQLVKRSRTEEPLPTDKRQLSSYRTRLGTMLEYAMSTQIDRQIQRAFRNDLRLTFAVAHEYPDFFVRDAVLGSRIRIEMKAVDADSDEQSARFEVLSGLIQGEKDVVVVIGWEWRKKRLRNGTACEFPVIFAFIVVPAADLAQERDKSVILRGGRVETTGILVPSKLKPGELTPDQHNAGKLLRLVHQSRKAEPFNLSQHIQRYLQFVETVETRLRRTGPKTKRKGRNVKGRSSGRA